LRLLAKVIHRLWESQDSSLLILPSSVPMDDGSVNSELTRYLSDVWEPIIRQDVDGPNSMPLSLDREIPTLGRYSACQRVARTLYMGTAPGTENQNPGIGAERVRLACAQPGETVATFGDALRRIAAAEFLTNRGGSPRLNRNTLVFLAPDHRELESLLQATAQYLAWISILKDRMSLNLDAFQESQATSKVADFDRTVELRIGATWFWALLPLQLDPAGEVTWETVRVTGNESLAKRTSAKLILEEMFFPKVGEVR
jgi:hypothetical protein